MKATTNDFYPMFAIAYLYIRWYSESELEGFGLSKKNLLFAYYVAAASIFEPERSLERLSWTKTAALLHTLKSHFKDEETRSTFVEKLL
jgi:ent-copalyl diphosphate synthase